MLVRTGFPFTAAKLCTVHAVCLEGSAILMVSAALPARRLWYAASMPLWPMGSPALYGAPSFLACSAVAAPTTPVSKPSEPDSARVAGELITVPSALRICALDGQDVSSVNWSPACRPG